MLTQKQKEWLSQLTNNKKVRIVPYDNRSEELFDQAKEKIEKVIGEGYRLEHHGASMLKISGQDEIDTYLPVGPDKFEEINEKMKIFLGEPSSYYPGERVHYSMEIEGKHIDVFLVNKEHSSWTKYIIFENYLKNNLEELEKYRILKEKNNGKGYRDYYTSKIRFINIILEKAKTG